MRLLQVLVDLVAASELLGMVSHNGNSSCRFCNHKGQKFDTMLFLYGEGCDFTERNIDHIRQYYHDPKDGECNGLKERPSVLLKLPYFNITTQVSADLLHNLCEGLCSKFLSRITTSIKDTNETNFKHIKLILISFTSTYTC